MRETVAALVAVFAVWSVAAAIWPLLGFVVPWDSKNHFYPMLRYLGASLAHGEMPFWNPYHFSGHPTVADPQSLLFTPTMLLLALAVPEPSMELFDLAVFAHLVLGAVGVVLLFRRRAWAPAGAVAAALVYMLGGVASARLQHTGMIFSYAFFPLALFFLEEALDRRSFRHGVAFAVAAALMCVGRDQVAFLLALALIGRVVHAALSADAPLRWLWRRGALLVVMAAVGGTLLAVPTLLTLQFLSTSSRPSFGFGVAALGSLPPSSLATFLFPDVFGSLRWTYDYWGPDYTTLKGATATDRATNFLFAGTLPALLVLWLGIAGGRLLDREFRYFLVLGAAALVYALGRYTPVFELFFDIVPGVDLYRRPADAAFVLNVVAAFAAGYFVHVYVRAGPEAFGTRLRRAAGLGALAAAACVVAAIGAALAYAVPAGRTTEAAVSIALGLTFAGAALALLAACGRSPKARHVLACLLVAATAIELVGRNAASSLNAEAAERYAVFHDLPPEQLQGLRILKTDLARRHARGEFPRVEILGLEGAWQNASMVLGIEDTLGYNPLRIAEYEQAVGPGENAVDPSLRLFPRTFRSYKGQLAGLLGLDYLVLDRPIERLPANMPRPRETTLLYGSGTMWIYRLDSAAPRAYLATRLILVEAEEALREAELPRFQHSHQALVDEESLALVKGDYGLRDTASDPDPPKGSVRITEYGRNSVTLTVETDRPAVVVLHDLFYPGWEARVNGEERPVLQANLLFRGVEVPVGRHEVVFEFRPLSINNLLSAANGLMALAGDGKTAAAD